MLAHAAGTKEAGMPEEQVLTLRYNDQESHDEAYIGVRRIGELVALCVSLRKDGDVQTVLTKNDAMKLADALKNACQ